MDTLTKTKTTANNPWSFLSNLTAIVGLVTVLVGVYGYFTMQGVADALGLDGGLLWSSPSDVLHYAFVGLMGLTTFLPDEPMISLWRAMSQPVIWLIALQVSVMVWVLSTTDRSPQAIAKRRQVWLNSLILRWSQWPFAKRPLYQWLLALLSVLIFPIVMAVMWLGVLLLFGGMLLIILFGMSSGFGYVRLVQSLPNCESRPLVAQSAMDSSAKMQRCVMVQWRDGDQLLRKSGLLLVATSSYILLSERHHTTFQTLRIPLSSSTLITTSPNH